MNTQPLAPLDGRWPNDAVLIKERMGVTEVIELVQSPAGENMYQDYLTIDGADSKIIETFATANGMNYSRKSTFDAKKYGTTLPAWLGINTRSSMPMFAHEITGELAGFPVVFDAAYMPASGDFANEGAGLSGSDSKRPVELDRRGIIRVMLPKTFPQMVLDSNKNDPGRTSTIPSSFKADQRLSLEGNFSQHFDFYSPHGLQVNTLTVLAPNFMQILVDSSSTFDVEFFGTEMILVTRDPIYTPSVMTVAVQALEQQLAYLDRLMSSWNYVPVRQPFDLLEKNFFDGAVTKIGPLRINPAVLLVIIITGFLLFALLISLLK